MDSWRNAHVGQQVTARTGKHVPELGDEIRVDIETEYDRAAGPCMTAATFICIAAEEGKNSAHCAGDQTAHVAPAFQCSDEVQVKRSPIKISLKTGASRSKHYCNLYRH
jgi:hypothetical protein